MHFCVTHVVVPYTPQHSVPRYGSACPESASDLGGKPAALPGDIDAKEQQIAAVEADMADAGFYLRPAAETAKVIASLETLNQELEVLMERWAELDA